MSTASEVLTYLRPNGGWVIVGDTWEGVSFIEAEPITKAQFEAGFQQLADFRAQKKADEAAAKATAEAKLTALGLTADDLKALGL